MVGLGLVLAGALGVTRPLTAAAAPTRVTYVASNAFGAFSVTEFDETADGTSTPVRTIAGSSTNLDGPAYVAVDALGVLYVTNDRANSITEYAPGASGDSPPVRTIAGLKTLLETPKGIAVDSAGTVYVANRSGGSVLVFAPGANGDVAPVQNVTGHNTGFMSPTAVAVSDTSLYVADDNANLVSKSAEVQLATSRRRPWFELVAEPLRGRCLGDLHRDGEPVA